MNDECSLRVCKMIECKYLTKLIDYDPYPSPWISNARSVS
jgi:hypothetical protein